MTISPHLLATAPASRDDVGGHARTRTPARVRSALPAATVAGGALVMLGAWLPWLTLFAGLQAYAGTAGLNGRLLLAGGAVAAVIGAALLARPSRALAWTATALGAAMTGLAVWVLVGLAALVRENATNPMMIARYGPGVFVALAGALVVTLAPLAMRDGARRSALGSRPGL